MSEVTRAAIYARFSSQMQREASIEDQLRECRAYAERRGWVVPDECIFSDRAISGTVSDRPAYQHLLRAAREGRFDVLIVDDLSRLSRDAAEVHSLHKRLRFRDVGLVAVSDGIDTVASSQSSGLIMGVKAAMNEEYLRDLAEKTRRGIAGRVYAGLSPGGQPYGYRSVPVHSDPPRLDRYGKAEVIGYRRLIVPEEAEVVRRIFTLYLQGCSSRRIAEILNGERVPPPGRRWRNRRRVAAETWSMSAIEGSAKKGLGILNNEAYLGRIVWNKFEWRRDPDDTRGNASGRARRVPVMRPREEWIVFENPALRIVSDELWQRTRSEQARRSAKLRRVGKQPVDGRSRYLLSGLLRCGVCGANMAMRSRHGYGCMTRANRGRALCGNSGVVNRRAMEAAVLAAVRDQLYGRDLIGKLTGLVRQALLAFAKEGGDHHPHRLQQDIRAKQAEIERVTASIRRCEAQGRMYAAEHLEAELDALVSSKKDLEAQQVAPEKDVRGTIPRILPQLPKLVRGHVERLGELLEQGQVQQVKSGLAAVVDEIEVRPGRTSEGRPCHFVRVKGALDRAFRLLVGTRQTSLVAGAGFAAKVRMIAVDAELQQWKRRMAIGLVPVGQEWLTAVL
jgi:DNA invertase Pin-like site-specific DNA recombinase